MILLVVVAMSMSVVTLAFADSQGIFNSDGGESCTKADTEATEHKRSQARAVCAKCLLFVTPGLIPTAVKIVPSLIFIIYSRAHLSHGSDSPWRPSASLTFNNCGTFSTL